jgi:predicted acyl esterase
MVPMSDGAALAAHHYPVPGGSPAPAVVSFVPYRKESAGVRVFANMLTSAGFHFLVADVRGFGGSDAPYEGLLSDREIQDGVDAISWVAEQPFCDGQVAMAGGSYWGANQLLIAGRRPPALRCIAPFVGFVDTYRDMTHRGGMPSNVLWGAATYLKSQHPATARRGLEQWYLDLMLDPLDNDDHRARSPESVLAHINVPTLCLGGWHDYFLRGTLRTYLAVHAPKRLVIGPWGHGGIGPDHQRELVDWLGWWLAGRGTDPTAGDDRVQLFDTGAERWRSYRDWPDAASRRWTSWYPHADGSLQRVPSTQPTPTRVLAHLDMVLPATNTKPQHVPDPTDAGMGSWGEDAVFVSAPADQEMTIEGPLALLAMVRAAGCDDVDLRVRVSVRPAGPDDDAVQLPDVQLTEGRLRASHRAIDVARSTLAPDGSPVVPWHRHDAEDLLPADRPVELAVEVFPVCHRLAVGDRLVVGITLTRADEGAAVVPALLEPGTRLLVPFAPG